MFKQDAILEFESSKEALFVKKEGDSLSLGTFFNSFNLYAIRHFTKGKKLTIKMSCNGTGSVKVFHETKTSKKTLFESDGLLEKIELDISNLGELGLIYPVFSGNFKLNSLSYEVDAVERKISTAVVFTTFNRQEFLIPNLYKLNKCKRVDKVVIIDNAKNVNLPDDLPKNKFYLFPNDNLGGSGGFTRGMVEAKKLGATHVFLMDDDITLLPEVTDKALSLISSLKDECKDSWLGFSMLPNSKSTYQYELGGKWNGVSLRNTDEALDLTKAENLHSNQVIADYNYSAWWSLIMPISVIEKHGLPLPLFIKFDDVEYGLRRTDEQIILTNGFAVWHEDFSKKHVAWLDYYQSRNGLITNALHNRKGLRCSLIRFVGKTLHCYLKGLFTELKLVNQGLNDFLKGPEFFESLDIVKQNIEIREFSKTKTNALKGIFIMPFVEWFYFNKLLFGFRRAKKSYKQGVSKLISEEFWEHVFNHD